MSDATRFATAIRSLLNGGTPNGIAPDDVGELGEYLSVMYEAYEKSDGDEATVRKAWSILTDHAPELIPLVANSEQSEQGEQSEPVNHGAPWRPFPTELLPDVPAQYVRAHSAALGVDEAMVAVHVLPVLAAAIGNSHAIKIKKTWEEVPTLWALVVSKSGTLKSPAQYAATSPINAIEVKQREEYERAREQYEYELEQYNKLSKAEKRAEEPPEKPVHHRLRVSDTTVESIAVIHADNPRSLILIRDELAGWLGSFDSYKRGESDLQAWIEMYEGRLVQVDRKSSDRPALMIRRPAVSVSGTIQPGVLREQLSEQHFTSGFAGRMLMAQPPERPRRWADADVTPDVQAAYTRLVKRLHAMPFTGEPRRLEMDTEARSRFIDFYNHNGEVSGSMPDGAFRKTLPKLDAITARLALIIQLCQDPDSDVVTGDAMRRAVGIAEWFRYEMARIYSQNKFEEQSLSRDERLARKLPDTFGWQEVKETWDIGSKRGTYKIIDRLTADGLIKKTGHGVYSREISSPVHFVQSVHFVHFGEEAEE